MTFVVVGGGPTGVEFSGALSELAHNVLAKDFPRLAVSETKIILVESGEELLSMFAPNLQKYALQRLEKMGVEVRLNRRVSSANNEAVFLDGGDEIPAHTLFWAAGVRAAPLADAIDVPKARGGRMPVEPDLSLKDHPEVFVIGDLMYLEQDGAPLPMVAPVAMQGGKYVDRFSQSCDDYDVVGTRLFFLRSTGPTYHTFRTRSSGLKTLLIRFWHCFCEILIPRISMQF